MQRHVPNSFATLRRSIDEAMRRWLNLPSACPDYGGLDLG